jgi:beta-glucosidase
MSVPRSAGQIPIFYNHKNGSGYNSGADGGSGSAIFSGGYVDGKADPLYPFGHGLSYTTFEVSDMALESTEVPTDGVINVSCKVTNTGSVAGDEIVQLYTSFFGAHVTRPSMQLGGFKRITLQPGESAKVSFELKMAQLGYYNENMEFVVEPGELTVMLGDSSKNLPLRQKVEITGKKTNVMGKRSYVCETTVERA